ETEKLVKRLQRELEGFKSGNPGKPVFSNTLLALFEESWPVASLKLGETKLRSIALLVTLVDNPLRYGLGEFEELRALTAEKTLEAFGKVQGRSTETVAESSGGSRTPGGGTAQGAGSALQKFTQNFTQRARDGRIDPVFGRDREIRQ